MWPLAVPRDASPPVVGCAFNTLLLLLLLPEGGGEVTREGASIPRGLRSGCLPSGRLGHVCLRSIAIAIRSVGSRPVAIRHRVLLHDFTPRRDSNPVGGSPRARPHATCSRRERRCPTRRGL